MKINNFYLEHFSMWCTFNEIYGLHSVLL